MINNVVLVSGVQQSDSVIHIHVSILFQILFPLRSLHNIEQSPLCYTVGPCWLSILNIAVCTCQSQSPYFFLGCFYGGKSPFLKIYINLFNLFIFGCIGSSLLCAGFLWLRRAGATFHCSAVASLVAERGL